MGKSSATAALVAAVFSLGLLFSGCGEYFRPVANPVFPPGGDPQRSRHALVVSRFGPCTTGTSADCGPGSVVGIDVSGDTYTAIFSGNNGVGRNPVFAINNGGTDYIVNRDDNSVSSLVLPTPPNSLNPPTLITLPQPSTNPACPGTAVPIFAAVAQNKLFVAESGRNCVAVIDPNTNGVTLEIAVSGSPLSLVATPDGTKLYVLQADGVVSVILVANNQKEPTTIPLGATPVWGTVSSDSTRVLVVKNDNTVSIIDTTPGGNTDTVISVLVLPVGSGPNYIVYDPALNRAYVTNTTGNSLSIIQNATAVPPAMASVLATVSLASAPCNGQHPISVTALADGSRVYVADRDGGNNGGQVCVLNTTSNAFTKNIPILSVTFDDQGNPIPVIPTRPIFIASDSDSFRVYTANSGSADVSVIQTADDTLVMVPAQNDIPAEPLTFCGGPPHIKSTPKGFVTTCPLDFVPTYIAMTP